MEADGFLNPASIIQHWFPKDHDTWDREWQAIENDKVTAHLMESVGKAGAVFRPVDLGLNGVVVNGHHRIMVADRLQVEWIPVRFIGVFHDAND